MLGIGDYANTSRLMNDNVRQFKGLQSQVAQENIQIAQQATANARKVADLDDLRNGAQEFAIKSTKELASKGLKSLYKTSLPFTDGATLQSIDRQAGAGLQDFMLQDQGGKATIQEPQTTSDSISNLNYSETPGQPVTSGSLRNPDGEPMTSGEAVEMTEMKPNATGGAVEEGIETGGTEAVEGATALTTDAVVETTAQSVGLGLDATGILAPLGAIVGLGADIFALFEGAKTTADFVGREVLKTKPEPTSQGVQIPMPTQPLSIAQKGYGVTPSLDTFDVQHNTMSSRW
tara:strand:- start:1056 stop:1925 length:870 start_codon:yes stop_codon:yes gene_type:complete